MKIRTDFVTNSSSSSFICLVCGKTYSGYDSSISDAEMCECQNGHTFCQAHLLKLIPENEWGETDEYSVPTECCPICNFKELNKEDSLKYLMKKFNITKESLLNEFSNKFNDYKELVYFIK